MADLDGDGRAEVAYVETPHLTARLRVWRWTGRGLTPVAEAAGLPNHRIGENDIAGGIRDCGAGPEIITANAGWSRLVATRLTGGRLVSRDIGPQAGRTSFAAALGCR